MMEELQHGFWTSLLLLMIGGGGEAPADPVAAGPGLGASYLVYAIETGDTWALTFGIERAYEAAGASLNERLTWQFQPYSGIVNWYNDLTEVINLSEMPADDEVAPYWDNWANVLTEGRWDWQDFFADDAEAREMARFNQFVLAAHEYGHALTYRYDPDHVGREDYAINCRELSADRLAAGLLEELAAEDEDFARWRARYADLVAAINGEIDEALRYTLTDFDSLDADCHILDVVQPDEDSMTPYASAFFARWQVMLDADLPPLAELYETHLFPHWQDRLVPGARLAKRVETVQWLDDALDGAFDHKGETGWHMPAFAPDGRLFVADVVVIENPDRTIGLHVAYGPTGGKKKRVLDSPFLPVEVGDQFIFRFETMLPLGPDHFLLASADMWGDPTSLVLMDFRRGPGGWRHRAVQPLPSTYNIDTRLRLLHDGTVQLEVHQGLGAATGPDDPPIWSLHPLSLEDLTLGEPQIRPADSFRWYSQLPDGRSVLIDEDNPSILLADDDGWFRIAGNGLQGFKDAWDPLEVEFTSPIAAIGLEGKIRILDIDPLADQFVIREISLVE